MNTSFPRPPQTKHHIAEYHGKQVCMSYIEQRPDEKPSHYMKRQFGLACYRISDNIKPGETGIVICPDGKRFMVQWGKRSAVRITDEVCRLPLP